MSIPRSIRVVLLSLTTLLLLWNCQTDMPPVARDDAAATDRDVPVTIPVVANDTASTGSIVVSTVAVIGGPEHGTAHALADGTVTYTPATDFVGTDSFSYVVTDTAGETSNTAMVTVTVRAVNRAPVANAGPDINAVTGRPVTLDGAQSFDPDRDPLNFAWQFVAVPPTSTVTTASLANAQTAAPSFTPDVDGTYVLDLTVSDGTLSSTDQVQVTAMGLSNVPPNANAGQDQTAQVGTVVLLDGRGSQDPDNGPQPLTFQWSFMTVPSGSSLATADLQGATTPLANFTPDVVGVYRVGLQVSDGRDASQAEVQITATPPDVNAAPNANAGPDMVVQLGAAVTLNGTASHDPDNGPQPLTYQWTLVSKPVTSGLTNASIQDATTATPRFTPDVAGIYVLRLDVSDGELSAFSQVLVKANAAPVAVDDTFKADQDQTLTVPAPGVLSNDTDGNNDPLTVVLGNTVSHGALTLNADGSFTYTPTTDFLGTDSFTYQANDGSINSNMAAVTVTVTKPNVNQAPVVKAATFSIAENSTAGTVVGTVTFTDPDAGQSHIFAISAGNSSNAFAIASSGQLTVATSTVLDFETTPSFSLTVQVTDNGRPAKSGSAIITVNLTNVNEVPVVKMATFTVQENSANGTVVGTVTFTDPDAGQSHIFAIVGGNTGGVFAINPSTGQLTVANSIALNIGMTPSFSLTVQVLDNGTPALSGSAIITINLTSVNHAPSFTIGPNQIVHEDVGPQTVIGWATAISAGPANESGQSLTFNITNNTNPTLFSTGPAVSSAGGLTYTPASNANGTATITVTLSDNGGTANGGMDTSAPQMFSITVNVVNDAPSFTVGPNQTVLEDAGPQSVTNWATGISAGPVDEAGQTLTFNVTNNTNAGLFTAGPAISSSGMLTYTPAANANGTATITLVLQDNGGTANGGVNTSLPQSFTITVMEVNDPPLAVADSAVVAEDSGATAIAVLVNDSKGPANESGQTLMITVVTPGTNGGTVAITGGGTGLIYTPAANFNGADSFTYTVCDNGTTNGAPDAKCATGTVTVTVTEVNDAPVASADSKTMAEDTVLTFAASDLSANDVQGPVNESGQTLTVTGVSATSSAGGTVGLSSGNITYTPTADFNGADSFTYTVCDNGTTNGAADAKCAIGTVAVTVTPVNDPPVAQHKSGIVVQANMKRVDIDAALLTGVTDADSGVNGCSPTFSVASITASSGGTVSNVNLAAGIFDFDPDPGFTGTAVVHYTVSDTGCPGSATSAPATISITVNGSVIWFVNAAVAGPGDGRLSNPFKTLASADAVDGENHSIFLYSGMYTTGLTLLAGERLIGQGVSIASNPSFTSFDAVFGINPPAGTIDRPSIGINNPRTTVQDTVTLANNSTVRGLDISTSSVTGLSGGVVSGVTVSEVSITTTSATAVNLNGTGGTVSLTSVSAGNTTAAPDPVNGISLTNTTGSFTVTGNGVSDRNGTGGTITNTTGDSIRLTNVENASFSRMNITNSGANGIFGTGVNGFMVDWCSFSNNGNAIGEGAIRFGDETNNNSGLVGSGPAGSNPTKITNSLLSGSFERAVSIFNTSGPLTALDVTNSTFELAANGSGFLIETRGNAVATVIVTGSTFRNNFAAGLQGSALAQSNLTLNIRGAPNTNTFTNNNEGVLCSNQNDADVTCEVSNNIFIGHPGSAIFVGNGTPMPLTGMASLNGKILNNNVTMLTGGNNHTILSNLRGSGSFSALLISGNKVNNNVPFDGIRVDTPDTETSPNFSVTVTNNDVTTTNGENAINLNARQSSKACFNVRSNKTAAPVGNGVQVRRVTPAMASLEKGGGDILDTASNVLKINNPAAAGSTPTFVAGAVSVVGNDICVTPTPP